MPCSRSRVRVPSPALRQRGRAVRRGTANPFYGGSNPPVALKKPKMESYLIPLVASIVAGFVNAIAGGGTLITFPALIFAGLDPLSANITNTVALWLGPFASALSYRETLKENYSVLKTFLPPSLFGALLGAFLLIYTPPEAFKKAVPFLIGFATLLLAFSELILRFIARLGKPSKFFPILLQFLTAIYGSYFGAGIGIMMTSSIVLSGVSNMQLTIALKNFLGFVINLLGAFIFLFSGKVAFAFVFVMMPAFMLGGYLGALVAKRLNQKTAKGLIVAWGFLLSFVFFLKEFRLL